VPLPIDGDLRAWDLLLDVTPEPVAVEAETRLRDLQSLERRVQLEQRDGRIASVVLLVNDTPANRRVLDLHRSDLRAAFPLIGREVLAALDRRETPGANGLVAM
jgi:hypothetical protein